MIQYHCRGCDLTYLIKSDFKNATIVLQKYMCAKGFISHSKTMMKTAGSLIVHLGILVCAFFCFCPIGLCLCSHSEWQKRQLLPQRLKKRRLVCQMLHWSGSKLSFLYTLNGQPLCLSGQLWHRWPYMAIGTWTSKAWLTALFPIIYGGKTHHIPALIKVSVFHVLFVLWNI